MTTPNPALYNLRDAQGESQLDLANALNKLAYERKERACVTANQVSRWERGVSRPSPFHRRLLADHFGVTQEDLGLSRPKQVQVPSQLSPQPSLDTTSAETHTESPLALKSQQEWLAVRSALRTHRVALAKRTGNLYADYHRQSLGLLFHPDWIPSEPLPLQHIAIEHDSTSTEPEVVGTEDFTAHVRPLASPSRRFHRYSQAIRVIDQPRLFENRVSWCLQDVSWADGQGFMSFGDTTYFESVDVCEALAHESAASLVRSDGALEKATWKGLTIRRRLADPFDLLNRSVGTSIDTLTIRQDADGTTFVLHDRNARNVAVAGGMLHVMPCGVFQPSSIRPAAQAADFDLWRNMMREYSEELLGNPEHDGDGAPINYDATPFGLMTQGLADGRIRAFCLGVALDALTLYGEILTVVVFDGGIYDQLFAEMVDHNDEGSIVKTGVIHPTAAIPFTEHAIRELIESDRVAPAGAGCLQLAWDSRRTILGK